MKFDLKRPCENCPFSTNENRIKFRTRERAEEIEESAYRNGFVCHQHATYVEDEDGDGGYDFGDDGEQHCAGALLMYLTSGGGNGNVPFEWLDEDEQERVRDRIDWSACVFENETEFLNSQGDEAEWGLRGKFERRSKSTQ